MKQYKLGSFKAYYVLWVMLIVEGHINVSFYVIWGRVVSLVIIPHCFLFILRNLAYISQQIFIIGGTNIFCSHNYAILTIIMKLFVHRKQTLIVSYKSSLKLLRALEVFYLEVKIKFI